VEGAIYDEVDNANANFLSPTAISLVPLAKTDSQMALPARGAALALSATMVAAPRIPRSAYPELAMQKTANLDTIRQAHGP